MINGEGEYKVNGLQKDYNQLIRLDDYIVKN